MSAKPGNDHAALTRRERQIMDILYKRGRATANEVLDDLPGSPHYSTVRTQLRVLEEKGHVTHEERWRAVRLHAGAPAARGAKVGACATLLTHFSTDRPSRSSRPCLAARARNSRRKNWIASPSSLTERRKKEADEDVLDRPRRARGRRSSCGGAPRRCGTGCSRPASRAQLRCRFLPSAVPAWPLPFATPTAFTSV